MNLVLVHGIIGFRHFVPKGYMNRIGQHLSQAVGPSLHTLVTGTTPVAGVKARASELRQQILVAFEDGTLDPAQPTHIFAHSQGGLDVRLMTSPANPGNIGDRIASVVLIGVPNRGVPLADVFLGEFTDNRPHNLLKTISHGGINAFHRIGVDFDGTREITASSTRAFNALYVNHPGIRYVAVAGVGRSSARPTCLALAVPHRITTHYARERNDGFIPLSSAAWGSEPVIAWPCDHGDLIAYDLDRFVGVPRHFDVLNEYESLLRHVSS